MIDRATAHLLRRHVTDSTHDHAWISIDSSGRNIRMRLSVGGLCQLGQSEIENLHSTVFGDKDVLRFQVAMNNPFLVRGRESTCDLQGVINGFALRESRASHSLTKRLTL